MTLKDLRLSKGYTQSEISSLLNVPLRTYKRLELNKKYIGTPKYNYYLEQIKTLKKHENVNLKRLNVAIIGAGYVGLGTGALLSKCSNITFVDIDQEKQKEVTFVGDFKFTTDISTLINIDVFILCLPTDYDEQSGVFNTKAIEETSSFISDKFPNSLIILKSTVDIGYTDYLSKIISKDVYFIPEFLRENSYIQDSLKPNKLIVGANKVTNKLKTFVKNLENSFESSVKAMYMSTKEAEASKLFSNTYLAMRVSFFNELDSYSKENKLNSRKIIKSLGLDPRIGDYYNNPSFGYSGYCLPKDTKVLAKRTNSDFFNSIIKSNDERKEQIAKDIIKTAKNIKENAVIGIYNLESSKRGDKYRPSSTLEIKALLEKYWGFVEVFDKKTQNLSSNFDEFINKCDLIVINRYSNELDNIKYKVYTRDIEY